MAKKHNAHKNIGANVLRDSIQQEDDLPYVSEPEVPIGGLEAPEIYKEKFSKMEKIAIENRMEVFHTLKFLQKYNFALLEENMLLREKCNNMISPEETFPRRGDFIDNVDDKTS